MPSLTDSLADSWLLFSRLVWCDPGVQRCQLKTCYVVTVVDVDAEVWSIFDAEGLVSDSEVKAWSIFWSQVKISKLRFIRDFEVWSILNWCRSFVEILRLCLAKILKWSSVEILKLKVYQYFDADDWLRFWSWCFGRDSEVEI